MRIEKRFFEHQAGQTHIYVALPVPDIHHEDRFPLEVLNTVLGDGMSSRLFREVREKYGLAYSVASYVSRYSDTGAWILYAGVGPDDQRVKAAAEWIRRFYDLGTNPGMGDAGLYYYYHTFAKALAALGEDQFVDDAGQMHDWRKELAAELSRRQQPNGSWVNQSNDRWLEGNPDLVTGYALLALSYVTPGARF